MTPMQTKRREARARLEEALATGDQAAIEAALPPWGRPRRAVPQMRFAYPENAVFPVNRSNPATAPGE